MRRFMYAAIVAAGCLSIPTPPASASTATDALIVCLSDSTTGRERKDLVRWIFAALSVHPEIKALSSVTDDDRDKLDKLTAALFERLLTQACPNQTRDAIKADGNASVEKAFERIGALAMQELMGEPAVNASFSRFTKYIDASKFKNILP